MTLSPVIHFTTRNAFKGEQTTAAALHDNNEIMIADIVRDCHR